MKKLVIVCAVLVSMLAPPALAQIASAQLDIQGMSLTVETPAVTVPVNTPATIATALNGKTGAAAAVLPGITVVAELTGPGLVQPITLTTTPGYPFQVPALSKGVFVLTNIRLQREGATLQLARPSQATITVADILQTNVTVKQLTPDELRARGIVIDGSNSDSYEFNIALSLGNGQQISVPFPVLVDRTTGEVRPVKNESPYILPPATGEQPPRWTAPEIVPAELVAETPYRPAGSDIEPEPVRPIAVPAAILLPSGLSVLHQHFSALLIVVNGAPAASGARVEDLTATIRLPQQLRAVSSKPSVGFGMPVPVVDKATGASFLVAQATGEAEWTLEGLRPGTHRIDFDIRATLKQPGIEPIALRAAPGAAVVVHDPRFTFSFAHPSTVREGISYSTTIFLTNTSAAPQTLRLDSGIPSCAAAPAGANVCLLNTPAVEMTLAAGEMRAIEYRLRPAITGYVYASAGSPDAEAISGAVKLTMGVSPTGVPLSPATLVLPHYAQFVSPDIVEQNLQLLGLGYSLATAPVNQHTAKLPRVIRSDIFQRAADIARAGQRIFIANDSPEVRRDAAVNLALDLLGNETPLAEWDQLRRIEPSGRAAGSAIARELLATFTGTAGPIETMIERIALVAAHRPRWATVLARNSSATPAPFTLQLRAASGRSISGANEATEGWVRTLPYADLSTLNVSSGFAQFAMVGRTEESVEAIVTATATRRIVLDLAIAGVPPAPPRLATIEFDAAPGEIVRIPLVPGAATLTALLPNGSVKATAPTREVLAPTISVTGARQDLFLEDGGRVVSVLFSRPVKPDTLWRERLAAEVIVNRDGVNVRRPRPLHAAVLQTDARVLNLTFPQTLSTNAEYSLAINQAFGDPLTGGTASVVAPIVPKIDNARAGGIVYGKVFAGDNTVLRDVDVVLRSYRSRDTYEPSGVIQRDLSAADGSFLFEFVERDNATGTTGAYRLRGVAPDGKAAQSEGAIRLPGRVQFVNLQFVSRGRVEGVVRYDDGSRVSGATIVVGSPLFNQVRTATADVTGAFRVDDVPAGLLTISARDARGNATFRSLALRYAGEILVQDLTIRRSPAPDVGRVFGTVRRSDSNLPVAGVRVGVYASGYAVAQRLTDDRGQYEVDLVPSGPVRVIAADWAVSRESAVSDFDLDAGEARETNLVLSVAQATATTAVVSGVVRRENPRYPGDSTRYEIVAGAIVRIAGLPPVTTDNAGAYMFDAVPASLTGAQVEAWDPLTERSTSRALPTMDQATIVLDLLVPGGNVNRTGTIRVTLSGARGELVSGYRVFEPGFPRRDFVAVESGVYELRDVPAGREVEIWAVAPANSPYGSQYTTARVRVEYAGHVAGAALRLPGQGMVRAALQANGTRQSGDVTLTIPSWDEASQGLVPVAIVRNAPADGYATFENVPAFVRYKVSAEVSGYAEASGRLVFEGDSATHLLEISGLSTIRGTVYLSDGHSTVSGALVELKGGPQNYGTVASDPAGTYEFRGIAPGSYTIVASAQQETVFRTGFTNVAVTTARLYAPIDLMMRPQGSVQGRLVYARYKRFDPANSANNVLDDTPSDLSDNAPVPLGKLWLRELAFPERDFGSESVPLTADATGRFQFANIFAGPLRITGYDSGNPELRGDWSGTLSTEGETITDAFVGIGADGVGAVRVTVVDPNTQASVANVEVMLLRGGRTFDSGSTNAAGVIEFTGVPPGTYQLQAWSASLAKSGTATAVVTRDAVASSTISLSFSGSVTGRLIDPERSGAAVAFISVDLSTGSLVTRTTTGADGSFRFDGVGEGSIRLDALEPTSRRRAVATGILTLASSPLPLQMELERTGTLTIRVMLPDDQGASSGVLAGAVEAVVEQRCSTREFIRSCEFTRIVQGNDVTVPGLFAADDYLVTVKELAGERRTAAIRARLPVGSSSDPLVIVLPAKGRIAVRVLQGGAPAAGARVEAHSGASSASAYVDANGNATLSGLLLGTVSVGATSVDGVFSAAATAGLTSQTTTPSVTLQLGSYVALTGVVDAENGGRSVGTRVVVQSAGAISESLTDGDGRYVVRGIPGNGGQASVIGFAPDGATPAARQTVTVPVGVPLIEVPSMRLDATRPTLLSIEPGPGAQSVSPDSVVRLTFSEPMAGSSLNSSSVQLINSETNQPVGVAISWVATARGEWLVTLTPPPPGGGERYALRSNTLYRVVVSGDASDLAGNRLPAAFGSSFTTSDYAEPRIVRIDPPPSTALPIASTLVFTFNEQLDDSAWNNGSARVSMYEISAPGAAGAVVATVAGSGYLDPSNKAAVVFAPSSGLRESTFYRVVISGIRDQQGNASADQTIHFFSSDSVRPHLLIPPIVLEGQHLLAGSPYTLTPEVRDGSASGPLSRDVARVDYWRVEGSVETYLATVKVAPFKYSFNAPAAPASGVTFSMRARARDLSGNESDAVTSTWTVKPNMPPSNLALTVLSQQPIYAGSTVQIRAAYSDEGTALSVGVGVRAPQTTGRDHAITHAFNVSRPSILTPWQPLEVSSKLPQTVVGGSTAALTLTVSDSLGLSSSTSVNVPIAVDPAPPQVTVESPVGGTVFQEGSGNTIPIRVRVVDAEVGVQSVTATLDATKLVLTWAGGDLYTGSLPVPLVDGTEDVPKTLRIDGTDYQGSVATVNVAVIVRPLISGSAPTIVRSCVSHGTMYPVAYPAKLRITAKGSDAANGVARVEFFINGTSTPVAAPLVAMETYESTYTIPDVADGTAIPVRAVVTSVNGLASELNASITAVRTSVPVVTSNLTINASNAATYAGKTVVVQAGTVTIDGPASFGRLLLLGGTITAPPPAAGVPKHLAISADRIFVACGASIDVSGLGYAANATDPGALAGTPPSGGSHIGRGSAATNTTAGSTYGSVYRPSEAGAGASCGCTSAGGGTLRLDAQHLAVAGAILADGTGSASGAGGSIWIRTARLDGTGSIEASSRATNWHHGGGGAIAIEYSDGASTIPFIYARSANSGTRAGAGTVYLIRPVSTFGDLVVDNQGVTGAATELPSLGSGVAQAGTNGALLVTDRASNIPQYFAGHWIEISTAEGLSKGTWRIGSVTPGSKSVTLAPNGAETINLVPGDKWQGVYRFDSVTKGSTDTLISVDPIRIPTPPAAPTSGSTFVDEASEGDERAEVPPRARPILESRNAVVSSPSLPAGGAVSLSAPLRP